MYIHGHTWTYVMWGIDGRLMVIDGHTWAFVVMCANNHADVCRD